ncbi:MAG: exodeoxyribonuclease III [Rickettsiales bacterium]|jgi:exodeoxyribonuclease-3|nr:exodeoxyribonuclease III [Rickettsiales bacterium]
MKILSININSIRAHIESFMAILDGGEYDVVCVQELKVDDVNFPHNLFETSGYNIKVHGQKSYNGVAIFSKYSIEDVSRYLPDYPDPSARFLECVINGRIRLINVYMPNGENIDSPKFPYKIEWMTKFGEYIHRYRTGEEAVVICGDFNVAIEDVDVWDPRGYEGSSISAPPARKIMKEWLNPPPVDGNEIGWRDEWRYFHPNEIGYTWYGYRGRDAVGNGQGLRLDYFLTNKNAGHLVKNCYIDLRPRMADRPTDHTGLVLEI